MKPRRKMTAKQYAFILILATAITAFGSQAGADVSDVAQLAMTVETLQKQIQELRATVYEQGEKIKVMERHEPVVRVGPSAVGEHIDTSEFDARLQEKIGTSDAWLKDLDFGGDFRPRKVRQRPADGTARIAVLEPPHEDGIDGRPGDHAQLPGGSHGTCQLPIGNGNAHASLNDQGKCRNRH